MKAVTHLNKFADSKVQRISPEQLQLHHEFILLEKRIFDAMEAKEYWNSDNDDAGKMIVKQSKILLKKLEKLTDRSAELEELHLSLDNQIDIETTKLKELTLSLKTMRQAKKSKSDQLIGFASARKTEEDSLLTDVDEILQEYGIIRAQYHGGDLSGGHLTKLMTYAIRIMERVQTYLLLKFSKLLNADAPTPANGIVTPVFMAEDEIHQTCLNVRTYLLL